jgi:virulence-associated protein VagC
MSPITAKVFKAGNSKALRLPCSLAVTAKAYEITPTSDGFMVVDAAARAKRLRALNKLMNLPALGDDWPRP